MFSPYFNGTSDVPNLSIIKRAQEFYLNFSSEYLGIQFKLLLKKISKVFFNNNLKTEKK